MDLYLKNGSDVVTLPILPEQIMLNNPRENQDFDSVNGKIKLIGNRGLTTLSIDSVFPSSEDKYYFDRSKQYSGLEYIGKIDGWDIVTAVCKELNLDKDFVINNFSYGIVDGSMDIKYTLDLEEYKSVSLTQKKV